MAQKSRTVFVCSACGTQFPKWSGKCSQCGEWNTINEEIVSVQKTEDKANKKVINSNSVCSINNIKADEESRYLTEIGELDRVLGGGLVKGSIVLLSGDPGIGKSTLLMQMCGKLCEGLKVLYVSGEESARQLKLRAQRLGVCGENLLILTETDIEVICEHINVIKPDVVMVDSIQTMYHSEISSSSGSVSQVRETTNALTRTGKALDIPIIIVGHVNKDGAIAGPKVMEHIVDAVLYFEGERNYAYRILRAIKNRFGSTNEIGVFEMKDNGLAEVENPSLAMLSERSVNVSGSCISCVIEGSRPILAEVQTLVTANNYSNPRRMVTGFDFNRFNLLLAVLEKRMGMRFSSTDAFINVIGGLKLDEPGADLSVALALVSAMKDVPVPEDVVAFGEVGLSGEVRSVSRTEIRIKEAARLGFKKCIVPKSFVKNTNYKQSDIEITPVGNIAEAIMTTLMSK